MFEALDAEGEMGPAFVVGHSVDLIEDERLDVDEEIPSAPGGQKEEQRLGRGDEDVRSLVEHLAALVGRRVAGADGCSYVAEWDALPFGEFSDLR